MQGKTDEAKRDMERLAAVKARREAAAKAKAEAEADTKAEEDKVKGAAAAAGGGGGKGGGESFEHFGPIEIKKMNPTKLKELLKQRSLSLQGSKKDLQVRSSLRWAAVLVAAHCFMGRESRGLAELGKSQTCDKRSNGAESEGSDSLCVIDRDVADGMKGSSLSPAGPCVFDEPALLSSPVTPSRHPPFTGRADACLADFSDVRYKTLPASFAAATTALLFCTVSLSPLRCRRDLSSGRARTADGTGAALSLPGALPSALRASPDATAPNGLE
ncbi:unnamed protein product [Phaeothamnion confervicola]